VPSALTTFGVTTGYLMSQPMDPSVPLFGMDPTIVYAGITVAMTGEYSATDFASPFVLHICPSDNGIDSSLHS
jgi:hypothetical protein